MHHPLKYTKECQQLLVANRITHGVQSSEHIHWDEEHKFNQATNYEYQNVSFKHFSIKLQFQKRVLYEIPIIHGQRLTKGCIDILQSRSPVRRCIYINSDL
jgi:hypothetical protein